MHFKISLVCFYLSPCIRKKACITLSYKILSAQNGREPVFLTKTLKVTYFTRIRLMLAAWTCWMLHIIIVIWFPESRDEVAHDFHQFWVRRHGEYGNLLKLDLNVVCLARRKIKCIFKIHKRLEAFNVPSWLSHSAVDISSNKCCSEILISFILGRPRFQN